MTFTNAQYWQDFCDWIASVGKQEAQQIMSEYIEQNFEHFQQFVENRRLFPPKP